MENLVCAHCGQPCLKDAIVSVEPGVYAMCVQCYSQVKSCAMCTARSECEFETNPDPSPKQIPQTIRQGNAVIQTIVPNPDRLEKTCKTLCKCWSDEFGCLKQNGTCGKYEEVVPKNDAEGEH